MANEDEKKSPDEYQYPDEYYSGEEYKPSEGTDIGEEGAFEETPPEQSQRRRKIFLGLGVLAAIAMVYAILTFTARQRATTPDQTAQVSAPPPVAAVSPPVQMAPPAVAPSYPDEAEKTMQQQIHGDQQAIATLQTQMQQLQSDLSQITENLTTITGQIQVIATQIKAIETERNMRESRKLVRLSPMQIYFLKALVPGRAWLQSLGGQTTTVTLGDRLPGYGIIQTIDTEQGIVTTSSGRLIQYGPRDS